ncbi:MAG TPA: CHASE2 domain-containing protein [Desulfobulbaceae bacterium]|nr:CHASE2 domain-containing protein [Desulfobulbaceae bacterium]
MLNRLSALIIATVLFGLLYVVGVVSSLSNKALDALFLLRGPAQPSQEIIIIGVDDDSLAALGPWPFPRKYHAELLARLQQAKIIGFDFLFSEPGSQDSIFNRAMESSPPIVLASARNTQHKILFPAQTLSNRFGTGHIEIILGRDGVVRRIVPIQQTGQGPLPAFALVMEKGAGITYHPKSPEKSILINHYGPEHSFLYLSYLDVLQGTIPKDFFSDRFVIIGAEALGIGDAHVTPFTKHNQTPGIEIQATILNNLLDNSWLKPLQVVTWFCLAGIGMLCLLVWPRKAEKWNLIVNISLSTFFLFIAAALFQFSFFLDPAPVLLFLTLCYLVHLVIERLWTAKRIYSEMTELDHRLVSELQQVYTNIPSRVFNLQPPPTTGGGVRRHLVHLQAGVKVLSLQHHFIENLLNKELPPLILWDRESGMVILANAMFNTFWSAYFPKQSSLPALNQFMSLLQKNLSSKSNDSIDLATISDTTPAPAFDISLSGDGQKKFFRVTIHSVDVENLEFSGVLALLTDVTEIKELEQIKDELVSVVSHELKLPLTVILGYGEMLSGSLKNEEKLYVDKMNEQARRLNRLIENFLDVTRLEHGRREIKQLPLDPVALIGEASELIRQVADQKNITITQILPYKATPLIGDAILLLQAITNLLDNAIKFSPEQTEITIKLVEEPKRFILCVADEGPGVPAESRDLIFKKFNRGKQEPGREGFGLGLNFVQQVVQKHGGKIWLEPETDSGATFCLMLPKKTPDPTISQNDICP